MSNDKGDYYIDKHGRRVFETKEGGGWGFSDGLTIVDRYPDQFYVDKTGKKAARYVQGSEF